MITDTRIPIEYSNNSGRNQARQSLAPQGVAGWGRVVAVGGQKRRVDRVFEPENLKSTTAGGVVYQRTVQHASAQADGYGDVTPVTVGGKVFGALITVVGLGMVALPAGIIASGFAQQLKVRTEHYQHRADEAWDDGVLSETELTELEDLRVELGLGRHTASQILDAERVRRLLEENGSEICPHCGTRRPPAPT
jgi:hypothetical protein